jgi:hypothetical protein
VAAAATTATTIATGATATSVGAGTLAAGMMSSAAACPGARAATMLARVAAVARTMPETVTALAIGSVGACTLGVGLWPCLFLLALGARRRRRTSASQRRSLTRAATMTAKMIWSRRPLGLVGGPWGVLARRARPGACPGQHARRQQLRTRPRPPRLCALLHRPALVAASLCCCFHLGAALLRLVSPSPRSRLRRQATGLAESSTSWHLHPRQRRALPASRSSARPRSWWRAPSCAPRPRLHRALL